MLWVWVLGCVQYFVMFWVGVLLEVVFSSGALSGGLLGWGAFGMSLCCVEVLCVCFFDLHISVDAWASMLLAWDNFILV